MNLIRLMWQRYHRTLLVLFIAIIGIYSIFTTSQINEWNRSDSYLHSTEFKVDYQRNPDDFYDVKRVGQVSMTTFVDKGLNFWTAPDNTNQYSRMNNPTEIRTNTGSQHMSIWFFLIILGLIAIFGSLISDTNAHFNGLLLGSKYKRKHILLTKMLLLIGMPLLATLIGEVIYYGSIRALIPEAYLNYGTQNIQVTTVLTIIFTYIILAGLMFITTEIIGSSFWAGTLYVCFVLSLILFIPVLGITVQKILSLAGMSYRKANETLNTIATALFNGWGGVITSLILALVLALIALKLFQTTSLERTGQFVLREKLKWPLWWGTLIYTGFTLTVITITKFDILIPIFIIIINGCMYYLIFKPQSLKHPFKSIS